MSLFGKSNDPVLVTPSGISVMNIRGEEPRWARTYTARLSDRASVEVTATTYSRISGRSFRGELEQPNGNRVWFEVERIADRIIDRELVPLVERAVGEILDLDRQYMRSERDEFTDESGKKWRRTP